MWCLLLVHRLQLYRLSSAGCGAPAAAAAAAAVAARDRKGPRPRDRASPRNRSSSASRRPRADTGLPRRRRRAQEPRRSGSAIDRGESQRVPAAQRAPTDDLSQHDDEADAMRGERPPCAVHRRHQMASSRAGKKVAAAKAKAVSAALQRIDIGDQQEHGSGERGRGDRRPGDDQPRQARRSRGRARGRGPRRGSPQA